MSDLDYLDVEVSYGTRWVSLNDGVTYQISANDTRDSAPKSYRRVVAQSMVLGGDYLVHAVPNMVNEQVTVWVRGQDQIELAENLERLEELFEQMDFRMRWTYNDYRETWVCQLPDVSFSRGQVWTHNAMAIMSFQVPRYPDVTRERIE